MEKISKEGHMSMFAKTLLKVSCAVLIAVAAALLCVTFSYAEMSNEAYVSRDMKPSAGDTYYISNAEQLITLSELVESGMPTAGIKFVLTADIENVINQGEISAEGKTSPDRQPRVWKPIGTLSNPFCGIFDGQGHTIKGLYVNSEGGHVGLFGVIFDGSVVNVKLVDSYISGRYYVGGIAGLAIATSEVNISGCYVDAVINSGDNTGGMLVGSAVASGGNIYIRDNILVSQTGITHAVGLIVGDIHLYNNQENHPPAFDEEYTNAGVIWIAVAVICGAVISSVLIFIFLRRREAGEPLRPKKENAAEKNDDPKGYDMTEDRTSDKAKGFKSEAKDGTDKDNTADTENLSQVHITDSEVTVENTELTDTVQQYYSDSAPQGYYYIKRMIGGGFSFTLKSVNHEEIITSDVYPTLEECKCATRGLASYARDLEQKVPGEAKNAGPAIKYEIHKDNDKNYRFMIIDSSNKTIAVSKSYDTESESKKVMRSFFKNAATSKIIIEDTETQNKRDKIINEIKTASKITVDEANRLIDDSVAEVLIESSHVERRESVKASYYEVSVDVLNKAFDDGNDVDIKTLIEKGIIPANTKKIRIVPGKALDKRLFVTADDFSIEAVKMIVLAGGSVKRR